ncbi:DUF971 domain-containing protein [Roseateles sp.]|uniref:DUF971 domain-containing protein n=1 Tax=Roseateles sp. TaxID=1971397 RepID=UPI0039E844B6
MNAVPEAVDLTPGALRLRWADGIAELSAARLRAACRCGGCRARAGRGEPAAAPADLVDAVPVGSYAINLVFSDGHDRGIYPWDWLHELSAAAVQD